MSSICQVRADIDLVLPLIVHSQDHASKAELMVVLYEN